MRRRRRDAVGKARQKPGGTAQKTVRRASPEHLPAGRRTLLTVLSLAAIVLLGLALRVSYLREIVDNPDFSLPQIDAGYFDYWARGLATGDWALPNNLADFADPQIRTSPFFRPPAYPYFLAAVYRLTGGSYLGARIVQMALGLANCLLAYLLGMRIFGRGTALVFALLMSVYWVFIFFEGELLATVLLVTLGLLLMLSLKRWPDKFTFGRGLAAGAVLGLFVLTRANALLFAPVVLAWSWWVARRRKDGRRLVPIWLGFALGGIVIVSPATIRNWAVSKDLVLVSTNAGISMYTGNNENATGRYSVIPDLRELGLGEEWTCFDYTRLVRGVESLTGRKMKHSEVSSYFVDKSLDFMRANPARTLRLMATKAALFWGPEEVPNNKSMTWEKANSATLRYLPGFPLPVSLGVLGLLWLLPGRRKRPGQDEAVPSVAAVQVEMSVLIVLFVLIYFLSYLPFFIAGRYRVPVIPFLFLFGAHGLYQTGQLVTSRRYGAVALRLAALAGLYLLASIHIVPYDSDEAQWHLLRATCYRLADKFDLAAEECRRAVEIEPNLEKAHRRLADMLFRTRDYRGSAEHYLNAIRLGSDRPEVHYRLGSIFGMQKQDDRAIGYFREALKLKPDFAEAHYSLANMLKARGLTDEAIDHFKKALEADPDYIEAHHNLATTLLSAQRFDEATGHFQRIIELDPNQYRAHNLLGLALYSKGDVDAAMDHYQQAIRLRPDYYQAHYNLANACLSRGRIDEAIAGYRETLKIRPDHAEAQRNLKDVLRLKETP